MRVFPKNPDWAWIEETYKDSGLLNMRSTVSKLKEQCAGQLIYLASPYTTLAQKNGALCKHLSSGVQMNIARWGQLCAEENLTAVSPILIESWIYSADFLNKIDPLDQAFWCRWSAPLLKASTCLAIAPLDKWNISLSVWRQTCWALTHNRRVFVLCDAA